MLTNGLLQGYAGKSKFSDVKRGGFDGKASHLESGQEGSYHDEWFVPNHMGGGQELITTGEEMFTRLYAGGSPSAEKLTELGITTDEVAQYLKRKIIELGDKTRLFEACRPQPDGDWQYSYEVLMKDQHLEIVAAAESITYKGVRVHLHPFILSPLK